MLKLYILEQKVDTSSNHTKSCTPEYRSFTMHVLQLEHDPLTIYFFLPPLCNSQYYYIFNYKFIFY